MSCRYSNRRWPLDSRGQLYGCKARLRELCAERRTLADRLADLEGANTALLTEVNLLRAAARLHDERLAVLQEWIAVGRAINVIQARTIAQQGTQLVAAWEALGTALHCGPADLDRARRMVEAVIGRGGEER